MKLWLLSAFSAILIVGCVSSPKRQQDGPPDVLQDFSHLPDAVPRDEPRSKYGNPESYVVYGKRYYVMASGDGFTERGRASWYGKKFHGRRTSSGEVYNMYAMTAAHKTLPLPSYVEVKNLDNGRTIVVRVNDRGPFADGRIIDLSYAAATKLGMIGAGTARVEIRTLSPQQPAPSSQLAGLVYLQVGAFSQRASADRIASELRQHVNQPVRVEKANSDGKSIFRVQIGPFNDRQEAEQFRNRARHHLLSGAKVTFS